MSVEVGNKIPFWWHAQAEKSPTQTPQHLLVANIHADSKKKNNPQYDDNNNNNIPSISMYEQLLFCNCERIET